MLLHWLRCFRVGVTARPNHAGRFFNWISDIRLKEYRIIQHGASDRTLWDILAHPMALLPEQSKRTGTLTLSILIPFAINLGWNLSQIYLS